MSETKTYPLRLPRSLKDAVERISKEEGTSINQFVATAVAEKVSALQTATFFQQRKARTDVKPSTRSCYSGGEAASCWRRDAARLSAPCKPSIQARPTTRRARLAASTPRALCFFEKIEKPLRSEFAEKDIVEGFCNHRIRCPENRNPGERARPWRGRCA